MELREIVSTLQRHLPELQINIKTQRRQANEEEPRKKRKKKRREKQKMNESAQMMGYKSYRDMERDNNGC